MSLNQIRSFGLNLFTVLITALSRKYLTETVENPRDEPSRTELMLLSFQKVIPEKELLWTELVRLVLLHRLEQTAEEMGVEDPDPEETFGPSGLMMKKIIGRLAGLRPCQFVSEFSYHEKVCLLQCLVDSMHDLHSFISILAQRVEEKTGFNKEKQEIFQSIKQLEQEQQEIIRKQSEPSFVDNEA